MLKKTIKYTNFNDEEVEEDFFFHLSKAELLEMELSRQGGLAENLKRIIDANDGGALIAEFKNIILTAYGQKSMDGKRFMKTQELRDEFVSTEAYSTLFMELATETDSAIEFINGIVPQGLAEDVAKLVTAQEASEKVTPIGSMGTQPPPADPEGPKELRKVTKAELEHMSKEQVTDLSKELAAGTAEIIGD